MKKWSWDHLWEELILKEVPSLGFIFLSNNNCPYIVLHVDFNQVIVYFCILPLSNLNKRQWWKLLESMNCMDVSCYLYVPFQNLTKLLNYGLSFRMVTCSARHCRRWFWQWPTARSRQGYDDLEKQRMQKRRDMLWQLQRKMETMLVNSGSSWRMDIFAPRSRKNFNPQSNLLHNNNNNAVM